MSEPITLKLSIQEMEEAFKNFPQFIQSLEVKYNAQKVGIVKLIFPPEFQPVNEGFDLEENMT